MNNFVKEHLAAKEVTGTPIPGTPEESVASEPLAPITTSNKGPSGTTSASGPQLLQSVQDPSQESTIATRIVKRKMGQKGQDGPEPKRPKPVPKVKAKGRK